MEISRSTTCPEAMPTSRSTAWRYSYDRADAPAPFCARARVMVPGAVNQSWTFYEFWIVLVGFLGAIVRQVVPYKKQANDAEVRLRDSLLRRVERLEDRLDRQQT